MKYLKFALHKRYFDTGMAVTNYLKYPLVLLGIAKPRVDLILFFSFFYAFGCYILGWWWLNRGMCDAENEVTNKFNPFVKQVRQKLNIKH